MKWNEVLFARLLIFLSRSYSVTLSQLKFLFFISVSPSNQPTTSSGFHLFLISSTKKQWAVVSEYLGGFNDTRKSLYSRFTDTILGFWIIFHIHFLFLLMWRRFPTASWHSAIWWRHNIVTNNSLWGTALVCAVLRSKKWTGEGVTPLAKPTANTSHLTGRTGCALAGFSMQMCACINTRRSYTHTHVYACAYFKSGCRHTESS